MNEVEKARMQREALDTAPSEMSSAERARLWAGLNRYLAAEAEHAQAEAEKEHDAEKPDEPAED